MVTMPLKSEPFTRVTQGCLLVHVEMTVAFPLCFKMTGAMWIYKDSSKPLFYFFLFSS